MLLLWLSSISHANSLAGFLLLKYLKIFIVSFYASSKFLLFFFFFYSSLSPCSFIFNLRFYPLLCFCFRKCHFSGRMTFIANTYFLYHLAVIVICVCVCLFLIHFVSFFLFSSIFLNLSI